MVLIAFSLLNKCDYFKKIKPNENYKNYIINNFLQYLLFIVLIFISVFPALVIAYSKTQGLNRVLHIIIGFLFSDIYLCYYVFNKFL